MNEQTIPQGASNEPPESTSLQALAMSEAALAEKLAKTLNLLNGEAVAVSAAGGGPRPRRPRKIGLFFSGLALAFVAIAGAVALAPEGTVTNTITPGSTLPGGTAADVTPVNSAFTRIQGRAQQIEGLQLYRIRLASTGLSDNVVATFSWVNPQAAAQALGNPNAFLQVALYYQSGTPVAGACPAGQFKTAGSDGSTEICVDEAATPGTPLASGFLTKASASRSIKSTQSGQEYLYLLASINVPGGSPPGQQIGLANLTYSLVVRTYGQ